VPLRGAPGHVKTAAIPENFAQPQRLYPVYASPYGGRVLSQALANQRRQAAATIEAAQLELASIGEHKPCA
jgi:hypothetical protein